MTNKNIFILAAGYNKYSENPCSLWSFGNGKSILDWQTHTFESAFPGNEVKIAVGYNYQKIIADHPCHTFLHVTDWEKNSVLHSFLNVVRDFSKNTLVMYGDTVFHSETLIKFDEMQGDVIVGIDRLWKQRFSGRSKEDLALAEKLNIQPHGEVEYTGLVKFSPRAMKWILEHRDNYHPKSNFIDLLTDINERGFKVLTYDVAGEWAEMNEQNDLVHFILGSKAETLLRIQTKLKKSKICDQITYTWYNWQKHPEGLIKDLQLKFKSQPLIVRSSSTEEDGWETANAGVFKSILNVDSNDTVSLQKAIKDVFLSYRNIHSNAQVLIQPFITDVKMSGVVFTCDLTTGAPYYIINYDDTSGRTDTITSGEAKDFRTIIAFRQNINNALSIDPRLEKVISAVKEIEQILGYNKLDIEFAIDNHGQCYIFQIRPITVNHALHQIDDERFELYLRSARHHFKNCQKKPSNILGNYTVFSGMTDWNPAEIIGSKPSALAFNLYNHLITDEVWAKQRAEFGYRNVNPSQLVHNFCAQPYVDCRASINSFIPKNVPNDTATRLIDAYLDLLKENKHLHDKLELDVVFTIWVPTFKEDAKKRFHNRNVTVKDIEILEQELKKLTANAFTRLDRDTSSIKTLKERFDLMIKSDLEYIDKIYYLIEDCRKFGTLAFSHAARAGFVAMTILKSLVKLGSLSQERMLQFQTSVPTVASDLQFSLSDNNMNVDKLIKQFGHLRPGTYDVNQLAYWENPEFYFVRSKQSYSAKNSSDSEFAFTKQELVAIKSYIDELPVEIEADYLVKYLKKAIQARESTKFEFTRNLSVSLDLMIKYGREVLGLEREDIGYLTFDDIKGLRTGQINQKLILNSIKLRKSFFSENHKVKLPSFICRENDFYEFEHEKSKANFITVSSIIADLMFIKKDQIDSIKGKIIAIPNADPGFDWIFSHDIAGLVTQHGGANSHMAIRCAELSIPAAIGIGDKLYDNLKEGRLILDCTKEYFENV